MSTARRKERDRLQREARILEVSRGMLVEDGYHGLNMDRIASQLEYAKGTIYNHFSCKEEIIIALAIETAQRRAEMFHRAASFSGMPRERALAIGVAAELFVRLYPDHFGVEQIIRSGSIREKTSQRRRDIMRGCETRCMSTVAGIVRDGIAQGHLRLPEGTNPEEMVFGLWSMSFGAFAIISTSDPLVELGIQDPFATVQRNCNLLLDGYGWQPLSSEYDYDAATERIEEEVFADEFRQAAV